jgi:four helix bundle protein
VVRAADSVPFNISEGCGLNTDPQLKRCLGLALGSANELDDIINGYARRKQLAARDLDLPEEVRVIRAMITKFQRRLGDDE